MTLKVWLCKTIKQQTIDHKLCLPHKKMYRAFRTFAENRAHAVFRFRGNIQTVKRRRKMCAVMKRRLHRSTNSYCLILTSENANKNVNTVSNLERGTPKMNYSRINNEQCETWNKINQD